MTKKSLLIFCVSLTMLTCHFGHRPEKPKNLIAKDKMQDILYDLYVVKAAKSVNKKRMDSLVLHPESYILNKHHIDSAQFANSNAYYAFDAENYKKIVEAVKLRIEKEKTALEVLEKAHKDSLKKQRDSLKKLIKTNKNLKSPDSVIKKIKGLSQLTYTLKTTRHYVL